MISATSFTSTKDIEKLGMVSFYPFKNPIICPTEAFNPLVCKSSPKTKVGQIDTKFIPGNWSLNVLNFYSAKVLDNAYQAFLSLWFSASDQSFSEKTWSAGLDPGAPHTAAIEEI